MRSIDRHYKEAAFTFVTDINPDLKQVVNTNKAILYFRKARR